MTARTIKLSELPFYISCAVGTDVLTIAPATLKTYKITCRKLQRSLGYDAVVEQITRQQIATFVQEMHASGLAPVSINGELRRVRAMWKRASEREIKVCDVDDLITYVSEPKHRHRSISEHQARDLINRCCVRDAAMLMLALRSGIRRQSLPRITIDSMMQWQNAAGRHRFAARIPQEKSSAPRAIFAGHDAAVLVHAWLAVRKHDSVYLFNRLDGPEPLTLSGCQEVWKTAVRRANLSDQLHGAAWHRLRHTFAQNALDDANDARIVAEWMGIQVETLLQVYATPRPERTVENFFDESVPHEVVAQLFRR